MSDRDGRAFDVVVYGANGVSGRRVFEELASRPSLRGRFAIAGRSRDRLEAARDEVASRFPAAASTPIVLASTDDPRALRLMAEQTRVVASCVGPYALYATPVVEACLETRTDCCDITGEVQWMRSIIERFDQVARDRGVRVVHACGFDSIPSDLGVLSLHAAARARGERLRAARYVLRAVNGRGSGGSFASLAHMFAQAEQDPFVREALRDPYSLCPEGARAGPERGEFRGVRWDAARGGWTAPYFMAPINERVVRRSNALLGYPYGEDFRYEESHAFGAGPLGLAGALSTAGFIRSLRAMVGGPRRSAAWKRVFPRPGEGPTREQMEDGFFDVHVYGESERGDGSLGAALHLRVRGDRDPGYGATGGMFAECALMLAERDGSRASGGVHTTASAFGLDAIPRMARAGVTFEWVSR